ncbi:unnamed protein product [Rotaria socialis]|uniref:C-type lectin domain-containing protein n=1 Tax=Rotaria socialis TaxID=392032 RepID=A0A817QZ15_9BILA|nr:unnamed protein product [Rotaria socialis]CAF3537382.1 unnamed protein product [Rotaria socialis]
MGKLSMLILTFIILIFVNQFIYVATIPAPAPAPNPLPYYLYQILTTTLPSPPYPAIFPMSDRDAADGFVHLARAINILPLFMQNYNNSVQLSVLKLNYAWMRENGRYDVRWEWSRSNSTIYPHFYGNTTREMIVDVRTWSRAQYALWNSTSVPTDEWLTDDCDMKHASFIITFFLLCILII